MLQLILGTRWSFIEKLAIQNILWVLYIAFVSMFIVGHVKQWMFINLVGQQMWSNHLEANKSLMIIAVSSNPVQLLSEPVFQGLDPKVRWM